MSIGHAEAEYLFLINKRKFPGVWKVFNEKNPSAKNTLEGDASQAERKRRNLTQLLPYVHVIISEGYRIYRSAL